MRRTFTTLAALAILAGGAFYINQNKTANTNTPRTSVVNKVHNKINSVRETKVPTQTVGAAKLTKKQKKFIKPYKYRKAKKFKMMKLDSLGRAKASHIQLSAKQVPTVKRKPYLTIRPSGWHNYKLVTNNHGKPYTTWLFNRGHLVGYQFCGLNQAPGNMITQTEYVNQGGLTGMNDHNARGQLYYENRLRSWLNTHPQDKLDYSVAAIYKGKELVPRKVRLTFVGLNKHNKQIKINMPTPKVKHSNKVAHVTLANNSPQAVINYATGTARVQNYKF